MVLFEIEEKGLMKKVHYLVICCRNVVTLAQEKVKKNKQEKDEEALSWMSSIAFTSPQGSTRDSYVAIFLVFWYVSNEKLALSIWYHQSGCVYKLPDLLIRRVSGQVSKFRKHTHTRTKEKDRRDRRSMGRIRDI